jgi:NAD(P)-dependent dehydrogenase (short-subunit alcohol dehydrogenase family)
MRLAEKVAVITGGGTGMGRATALLFAREGACIVVAGRRQEKIAETACLIIEQGGKALAVPTDVRSEKDAERLIQKTIETFHGLHILVNNAGVIDRTTLTNSTIADWDRVIDTNLKGIFLVSRCAIPKMIERGEGSIVNNASVSGFLAAPNSASYQASKGGVIALTKSMALDYAKDGIRVNCVCPGLVETPMPTSRLKPGESWEERAKEWVKDYPLGRLGKAEDVANAILFLASDEASWITGIALVVDGGMSMK